MTIKKLKQQQKTHTCILNQMEADLGLQPGVIMMGYVYARIPLVGCIQFNPFAVLGTSFI